MSCTQCHCATLITSAVGGNCMTDNSTCYLINNYTSTDIGLTRIMNTTFFFRQIPPEPTTTTTQTTTTTSLTTTTPSCTTTPTSNLLQKDGSTAWSSYSFIYRAVTTMPTLVFAFKTGPADTNYLDDVSVVDSGTPLIQLLKNPGFENSTSVLNGWITWCTSGCGSGNQGQVTTGGCYSGNCYVDHCQGIFDYLSQSFPAMIGNNYTISFRLRQTGGGAGKFYANIED